MSFGNMSFGNLVLASSSSCLTSTHGFCSLLAFAFPMVLLQQVKRNQNLGEGGGGATHCQLGLLGPPRN
jgi:hypothetical protein